jgi:hypothetical protein
MDGLIPESIADLLKGALKCNMRPEEVCLAFDYDYDKQRLWRQ